MITLTRPETGVELTRDPRFSGRIRRLVSVSAVALGLITVLAVATTEAPLWLIGMLASGWVTMPLILSASLRQPLLRYGLVIPATVVTVGLVAVCWRWLPVSALARAGWYLVTTGVATGGLLGAWFWYRIAPVPRSLTDPFSTTRLALVAVHAGMVSVGIGMILWVLFW